MPLLKKLTEELTRSYFVVSLGESLFVFALATMGIVWGFIFDSTQKKNIPLFFAIFSASICVMLTALATTPQEYLIYRLLTGFFVSAVYAYAIIIIKMKYPPGERMGILLLFLTIGSYGQAMGTVITVLLNEIIHWRKLILGFALILFSGSLPILFIREEAPPTNKKSSIFRLSAFFRIKTNVLLGLQGFFGSIPWAAFGLFLLYAIQEKLYCDFLFAGLIVGLSGLLPFTPIFVIPKLDALRKRKHFSLIAYTSSLAIFLQMIFIEIFFIYHLPHPIVITYQSVNLYDITTTFYYLADIHIAFIILLFILFTNVSFLPSPITRNIITDVNNSNQISTSLMTLRFFELAGQSMGLLLAGILLETTESFVVTLKIISLSWLVSAIIWILVAKVYTVDVKSQL